MNIESNLLDHHFAKGRGGRKPDVIVIHIQEGTMAGTDSHFRRPPGAPNPVSAHYGVPKSGDGVVQWVEDEDTAYAQGLVVNPTAEIVRQRQIKPGVYINPNSYCLSIECEGFAKDDPSESQMGTLVELVDYLAEKHQIPLTRRHVLGHKEIRADKTCPGKIDVDEVVRRAVAYAQLTVKESQTDTVAALNNLESHLKASLEEVGRLRKSLVA